MKKEDEIISMVGKVVIAINSYPEESRKKLVYELEGIVRQIKINDQETVNGFVYLTTDLTQFKTIEGNRIVNVNTLRMKKLADSIRNYGVIVPLVKNTEGGLIDGQRRIAAIRKDRYGSPG